MEYTGNAILAIVAAVNCHKINPDNPLAVADALPEMYKALKLWQAHNRGTWGHYCGKCAAAIHDAIAKAEGRTA